MSTQCFHCIHRTVVHLRHNSRLHIGQVVVCDELIITKRHTYLKMLCVNFSKSYKVILEAKKHSYYAVVLISRIVCLARLSVCLSVHPSMVS